MKKFILPALEATTLLAADIVTASVAGNISTNTGDTAPGTEAPGRQVAAPAAGAAQASGVRENL